MDIGKTSREPRRRSAAAPWAALLLAVAPLPGAREVSIPAIFGQVGTTAPTRLTSEGMAFDVREWAAVFLPLPGTAVLQVDYRVTGTVLLTWGSAEGTTTPSPHSPPWHHQVLKPGSGRVTLDFRTTSMWTPERVPFLYFEGDGGVVLTGLRTLSAPAGREAWTRERDEALRWAPIRIGHTTINLLDPPTWKESEGIFLFDVLGVAFVLLAVGGSIAWLAVRRRWVPGRFLAVAGVGISLAGNGVFLVRAWPDLALRPRLDTAERLRENFHLDPVVGALAALARESIRPGERVGVQVAPNDWFRWEAICFHLAPRPCVNVLPKAIAYDGLPGVERLVADQLDVVVYVNAGAPLLPGFSAVATIGPGLYLARRR